ncbi:MAG: alpha/beta hydrolase, partial [Cyclobacteriaceae bacterium]
IILVCTSTFCPAVVTERPYKLEDAKTFFPYWKELEEENIDWKWLTVPEDWSKPEKEIRLAVARLNSFEVTRKTVVYIAGGPGGWSVGPIGKWLNHPLRKEANIILVDLRGTGFSQPQLCPDLGEDLLQVFAADGNSQQDVDRFVKVGESCRKSMIRKGIDLEAYSSSSVAKDLNALRESLGLQKWFVYGVSYGTWIAQVYASDYPQTVEGLILDSPIADISLYYDHHTGNYEEGLSALFASNSRQFPDLENTYKSVIKDLVKQPLAIPMTVNNTSGEFIVNVNDFKIIIHQALYNHQSLAVLPMIIKAFKERKISVIKTLVQSLSGNLKRDFGTYYCMTCNDLYQENAIAEFDSQGQGISFYRADLAICKDWNLLANNLNPDSLIKIARHAGNFNTLIFTGEYDPITPLSNGRKLADKIPGSYLMAMDGGHTTGSSPEGKQLIASFVENPTTRPSSTVENQTINFISEVSENEGVFNIINSFRSSGVLFFAPLGLAFLIILMALMVSTKYFFTPKATGKSKWINGIIAISSLSFIISIGLFGMAVFHTVGENYLITMFGLSAKYDYTIDLVHIYLILTGIALLYFIINFKQLSHKELISMVIFSLMLPMIYLLHWAII